MGRRARRHRQTCGMDGMRTLIASRLGPRVEIPPQIKERDLPPRLRSEIIRRAMAARRSM
jgi:hypothetical protein